MSEEIDNKPKNAFEAAIDAATGYKPGDENGGTEAATAQPETASVRQQEGTASVRQQDAGKAEKDKEKRDWVSEAYECFIKNAVDLEPTNPKAAVWEYFKKNATDELKAKVEAEGKTGESCWTFIEAVAKKALHGRSGHIDPVAVYAIAMHYFQDVPKDWDQAEKAARREATNVKTEKKGKPSAARPSGVKNTKKIEELERKIAQPGSAKHALELKAKHKIENERVKEKEKKLKAKKRGGEQGFFFDLMETEPVVGEADVGMDADAQDGKEAGDAE